MRPSQPPLASTMVPPEVSTVLLLDNQSDTRQMMSKNGDYFTLYG